MQVSQTGTDGKRPTLKGTVQELVSNHGIMGFTRGLVPRMANTALWYFPDVLTLSALYGSSLCGDMPKA